MTTLLEDNADNDQVTLDPNKNYFEELVGENRKFKDSESLAKGKFEADSYIQILHRRLDSMSEDNKTLREESTTRARLEELIDQLQNKPHASSENNPPANDGNTAPFDPKQLDTILASKFQEYETKKRQDSNFNIVKEKLKEKFGNNYQATLKEQINSLGLSTEFVDDLARNHPTVLFKTLGLDQQYKSDLFQGPPQSSIQFAPQGTKRTWSYYEKMRKEKPELYSNPKTAVQMHKDAIALGPEFQDGDWNG